jgi:hypothetical protein
MWDEDGGESVLCTALKEDIIHKSLEESTETTNTNNYSTTPTFDRGFVSVESHGRAPSLCSISH